MAKAVPDALPLVVRSRAFEDGLALLALAEQLGIEDVVAKRSSSLYRCGERPADWVKVKTAAGRAAMARRHESWGS